MMKKKKRMMMTKRVGKTSLRNSTQFRIPRLLGRQHTNRSLSNSNLKVARVLRSPPRQRWDCLRSDLNSTRYTQDSLAEEFVCPPENQNRRSIWEPINLSVRTKITSSVNARISIKRDGCFVVATWRSASLATGPAIIAPHT